MKNLFIVFLLIFVVVISFSFSNTQPIINSPYVNIDTTGPNSIKTNERKYNWYGKLLSRQEYLDTLNKKFKEFNDSLRKEQKIKN